MRNSSNNKPRRVGENIALQNNPYAIHKRTVIEVATQR